MKKRIALVILSLLLLLGLTACNVGNEPQTAESYTAAMEEAGFTVEDVTDQLSSEQQDVTVLAASNESFRLVFYELEDTAMGGRIFRNAQAMIEEATEGHNYSQATTNIGSYGYYGRTAGGGFYMTARIKHTVLYCATEEANKDAVIALVEALGYK